MSIMKKAEALGKALVESEEFSEMKNAEMKIEENEEAKSLLDDFEAEQKKLQMMQQNGQQITPDQQKNLQSIQTKMQSNEQIKEYMEAQQKFNKVMNSVNQTITTQLQGNTEDN